MSIQLITTILLLTFCISTPQVNALTKYKTATVHFRNGDTKEGKVKIPYGRVFSCKFIEEGTKKKVRISAKDVEKIDVFGTIYRFVRVVDADAHLLLIQRIAEQKVGVYYYEIKPRSTPYNLDPAPGKKQYFKKSTDDKAVTIKGGKKRFKKNLAAYFNDCPEVSQKIKEGFFEYKGKKSFFTKAFAGDTYILKVVDFYNESCE